MHPRIAQTIMICEPGLDRGTVAMAVHRDERFDGHLDMDLLDAFRDFVLDQA